MYQGIYVAPLQIKANRNVNKDLGIYACRRNGGMLIVAAEAEEMALSIACKHTNIEPDNFQINKLPNASSHGEPRVLYMEVHDEQTNE